MHIIGKGWTGFLLILTRLLCFLGEWIPLCPYCTGEGAVHITTIKVLFLIFFNFLIFNLKVVIAHEDNVMGENPNLFP
jgi:hypothetical protein